MEEELEPAYVEVCKECGVDPVGLHVDLQNEIDTQGPDAPNSGYVSLIFSLGDLKVIKACIEVAGGF